MSDLQQTKTMESTRSTAIKATSSELIRDTLFGHILRFVTGKRVLRYQEEIYPELWKKFVHKHKSGNMAHHGAVEDEEEGETEKNSENDQSDQQPSRRSSDTEVDAANGQHIINEVSGKRVDPEKGRDAHIVDWWGPDDPENPQNWSTVKKFFVTFEITFLTFSVYIGSAIYSSGIEDVTRVFGVSQVAATLGLTLFVLGYALGPVIWAPMSEIPQIGRNPVYIITLALFVILQVPTALAVNFGMLLAFRFITGFIGSPSLATGGASIGDMYAPNKRAYGIAIWGVGAVCGPTLGPLVGGFAAEAKGWTWTIWELMWLSGFALVLFFFFLPETSSANILYRRTRRLRKLTGNEKLICEPELQGEQMTGKDIVMMVLVRPITLNFTEPMVFLLNLYIALVCSSPSPFPLPSQITNV
jgi:DHA1 family multidrug resistance protein-like MFS transporter